MVNHEKTSKTKNKKQKNVKQKTMMVEKWPDVLQLQWSFCWIGWTLDFVLGGHPLQNIWHLSVRILMSFWSISLHFSLVVHIFVHGDCNSMYISDFHNWKYIININLISLRLKSKIKPRFFLFFILISLFFSSFSSSFVCLFELGLRFVYSNKLFAIEAFEHLFLWRKISFEERDK